MDTCNEHLLTFALGRANLTEEDALKLMEEMTNKEIINQHTETYSAIWLGKDGRWRTYLPNDQTGDRKQIAKSTEEKLNKEIIAYYKAQDTDNRKKKITLEQFYPEWLDFKALHTDATTYVRRINDDWNKYYVHTPIIAKPLRVLDKMTLDEWSHELIKSHAMTKKQFYNSTIIMRQALELAVEKGIIEQNPLSEVKINSKLFRPVKKKVDATQVYLVEEQPQIEAIAMKDFEESGYTASLGIILSFQLGARVGEMVGLKWSDISEEKANHLHIQRMERLICELQADGSWKTTGQEVVEHTKSDAGNRNVYLTQKARNILDTIRKCNRENGFSDSEYIFVDKNGERIHCRAFDTRIRKYCRMLGISEKGMHKIRKTYISALVDSSLVNINTIRAMVGHEDERTTLRNYCFNRQSDRQTEENLERALDIQAI